MRRLLLLLALFLLSTAATGQNKSKTAITRIAAHVVKPGELPAPADADIKVPDGFRVRRFAEGLGKPRIIAVAPDGAVYVTRRETDDVVLLRDTNNDGRAEPPVVVAQKPQMHGIALDGNDVFLVTVKEVFTATRQSDGQLSELHQIIGDLPDGGQHPNRTLALGPDKMLYLSVGSTCNACDETNPENGTLLRVPRTGQSRSIFASGLRNTIGFGWHPSTGQLWGMDHGIDWLGDDDQGEELNLIEEGKRYGWPYVYADGRFNPQDEPPGEVTHEQWDKMSQRPTLLHTAHAAPMQMAFYNGTRFPASYRGGAFVAMHGSWNRLPPSGYEVVHVRFDQGRPTGFESFASGFLLAQDAQDWAMRGRPAGIAVTPDGELLVSDDLNGVIYAISYGVSDRKAR